MTNEIVVPDYLKKMTEDQESGASLVTSTSSVPRISLKGRQFRFIIDGDETKKKSDAINVVILGAQPEQGMSKTFYAGKYDPSDTAPPDCSSSDGIKPDHWINNPQSDK